MARTPIWKSIATALKQEITKGHYAPGDKLPTESALAARFGVNRHTVRHAISSLAEEDLLFSRRGAGVFVTQVPTEYPIGKRVRFHQNLLSAGHVPAKEILSLETRPANDVERRALVLQPGDLVHVYDGLSLSDGQPIAVFTSVFPAARFPNLPRDLRKSKSVTSALKQGGVADYIRTTTRLEAKLATAVQALQLQIREGAPILQTIGVNVDPDGQPVELGNSWFAGDRITLTLNTSTGETSDD
jgi:GntR family phosphonate transport system transcriptional regulator